MKVHRIGITIAIPLLLAIVWLSSPLAQPRLAALASCSPPRTPEPFNVDPVTSPTSLLTQSLGVRLGMGRAITVDSEAGTTAITGTFSAFTTVSLTIPLLPNLTHHLTASGRVEYAAGCFYTLNTTRDRNSNPLIIVQQTPISIHLPLVQRNFGGPTLAAGAIHHAVRFTVWRTQRGYIHPATHFASDSSNPNYPPMGLRLRLKASYDISGFTGQARVTFCWLCPSHISSVNGTSATSGTPFCTC